MANELIIPYLSPISFVPLRPAEIPQYQQKLLFNYRFEETIKPWETRRTFKQRWLLNDSIRLQVKSNFGGLSIQIFRCDGSLVNQIEFSNRQQDQFRPGYYIRQVEIDVSTYGPGEYYFQIPIPGGNPYISEPQSFVRSMPNSVYVDYSHFEKKGEVYFQSPYSPKIRLPGGLYYDEPGSKTTTYEDQPLNIEVIQSIPFDTYRYVLGDAGGIPPWLIRKVARIFGCSELQLDGHFFTKSQDAAWSKKEAEEGYPMKGWSTVLRERFNDEADYLENDVVVNGRNSMIATVDSAGFGIEDTLGGGFIEIEATR